MNATRIPRPARRRPLAPDAHRALARLRWLQAQQERGRDVAAELRTASEEYRAARDRALWERGAARRAQA
jgi:hypothetical protein